MISLCVGPKFGFWRRATVFAALMIFMVDAANAENKTVFIRKPVTGRGVTAGVGQKVRDLVAQGVNSLKQVGSAPEADVVLRPTVLKAVSGYIVRIERTRKERVLGSQEVIVTTPEQIKSELAKLVTPLLAMEESKAEIAQSLPEPSAAGASEAESAHDVVAAEERTPAAENVVMVESGEASQKGVESAPALRKHWYVGLGPVWSTALLGATGTKYNVSVAYNHSYSERVDLLYFYDGNFNSDQQGKSDITTFGVGADMFLADRLAANGAFLRVDVGYGGSNRNQDGAFAYGAGVGMQFYRNRQFTFEALVRYQSILTSNVSNGVAANPNTTQLRFGIYF